MRLQRTQVTWSQLRVGIFALICLSILLWVALFAGNSWKSVQNRFTVQTILDSASGLKPGDPVRLAGIEVGAVKKIDFIHQNPVDKIRIQLNLNRKAAPRLRSDSVVQIKSVGFTESRYVDISLGTSKGAPVAEGATLAGVAPVGLPIILNRAIAVSENLNSSLARFESLVDRIQSGDGTLAKLLTDPGLYTNLNHATGGISDVVGELKDGQGLLSQLLSEEELAENIAQSAAWAAKWGQQVTQGEGTLGKLSTDPALFDRAERILKSLDNLEARLDHIDSVIASTKSVVRKIDRGEGTAAKVINNPELYNQSHTTFEKMGQFIDQAHSGEGTIGRLVSDPTLAKQITASSESIAALTDKLNTPGSTLDRLATGSDLLDHLLATTNQLESIMTKINSGAGSLGKLTHDQQTAEDLSKLINNLKALSADVQAHPKRYVEFSLF
ncbi:MAG: MlaD family protein [Candidatus Poribacteria bacterium]|nr:MlaD family protein [Candidatus Poribacteria bacterium]